MSYFFSQPDDDDEPTIWLELDESNAVPMLRKVSLYPGANRDELWALIERAVSPYMEGGDDVPGVPVASARERALQIAEAYIAETLPSTPPLKPNGYPVDGWRAPTVAERLDLVLKTARFLLGETE